MASRTHGLGAARIEPVRRIARRVQLSPGAGRYLAVGSSPALRAQVHAALAALLGGPERVVVVDVSAIHEDPWNTLRRHQQAHGLPTRGVLYVMHGLKALSYAAEAAHRPHPYAQLNLSRDAWGATGTHLLLWLDGVEELDRFLQHAPDLWSHRDLVAWFLSRADFVDTTVDPAALVDRVQLKIDDARRVLADPASPPETRVMAAIGLADGLREQGQPLLAWEAIQAGETALRKVPMAERERLTVGLGISKSNTQKRTYRVFDAIKELNQLLIQPVLKRDIRLYRACQNTLAYAHMSVDLEKADALLRALVQSTPPTEDLYTTSLNNLILTLLEAGRTQEAHRLEDKLQLKTTYDEAYHSVLQSERAAHQGAFTTALQAQERAARLFEGIGQHRDAALSRREIGSILSDWGHTADALPMLQAAIQGDDAARLKPQVQLWYTYWCVGDADAAPLLSTILTTAEGLAAARLTRAVSARTYQYLLDLLADTSTPDDPLFPRLQAALQALQRHAKQDNDPEVDGWAQWGLAQVAVLRGDAAAAYKLADQRIVPWCHRWRGLEAEANAWGLLARTAPTLTLARQHAERAVAKADESISLFSRIDARRTRATVLVRAGEIEVAAEVLRDALQIAHAEGLRPQALKLSHQLAELPGFPGAQAAANEALTLAGELMLPRDEARALLNLYSHRPTPRMLDRATEIIEELGPPNLRRRLATLGPASG